jgi:hypothetical protein
MSLYPQHAFGFHLSTAQREPEAETFKVSRVVFILLSLHEKYVSKALVSLILYRGSWTRTN